MPMLASLRTKENAMTVEEIAKLLSVSERQIYQMVSNDEIPHFKIGKAIRFDPCVFASWLEGQLDNGTSPPFPTSVRQAAAEETLRRDREYGRKPFKSILE